MNAVVNITAARSSGTVGLCIDLAFVAVCVPFNGLTGEGEFLLRT